MGKWGISDMHIRVLKHARTALTAGVAVGALGVLGVTAPAADAATGATIAAKALSVQALSFSAASAPAGPGSVVTLTWTIADKNAAAQGIGGDVYIQLQGSSPNSVIGTPYDVQFAYENDLNNNASYVSGTPQDSTYTYTFPVPHYANATTANWVVSEVSAQDSVGSTLAAKSAALSGFNRSVTGTGETVDATVASYDLLQQASDFRITRPYAYDDGTSTVLQYSLQVQENSSGFWKGSLKLAGPGGAAMTVPFVDTPYQGSYSCGNGGGTDSTQFLSCSAQATIPAGSPAGVWTVSAVTLTSNVGKSKTYNKLDAVPITVTSDGVVSASGFSVTPSPVDNWTSSPTVQVGMTVAGAQGGISAIYVDTDGQNVANASCLQLSTTPTANADGSFSVPVRVDQDSANCQVDGIAIVDGDGDVAVYGTKYGAPDPDLTIATIPDTTAPAVTSASLSATSVPESETGSTTAVHVNADLVTGIAPVGGFNTVVYDSAGDNTGGSIGGGMSPVLGGPIQLPVYLPPGLAPGTYTISFELQDAGYLTTTYGGPYGIAVPGGPLTLTITAS